MADHKKRKVKKTINNFPFVYTSHGLGALGYVWDPAPPFTIARPLNYWKAQLAFRGFSPAGSNIEALKKRLRNANTTVMAPAVAIGGKLMKEAWEGKSAITVRLALEQEVERLQKELQATREQLIRQQEAANEADEVLDEEIMMRIRLNLEVLQKQRTRCG